MSDAVRLVIWAQSVCRSTMALYREVKRLAGVEAIVVLRADDRADATRRLREAQGQEDCSDVVDVVWDGAFASGVELLDKGSVHVFSGYQVSAAVRRLMVEAKRRGCRVVGYDEAPCEMCLGGRAFLKRLYYALVLPMRVGAAVGAADLFVSASGNMGISRLVRLGWRREQIVPFGYASGRLGVREQELGGRCLTQRHKGAEAQRSCMGLNGGPQNSESLSLCVKSVDGEFGVSGQRLAVEGTGLRVLHTGVEAKYRGVDVLKRAVASLKRRGVDVDVKFTGGKVDAAELPGLYEWADVVVACGLCEPWGMRVNDVLLEGVPVVVSDGMGAAMLCDAYGCGCVVPKSDARALAAVLRRCAEDREFYGHLKIGAMKAARALLPQNMAREWVDKVVGR